MEHLIYFFTVLVMFCAAFFVIALFSSKLLDSVVILPQTGNVEIQKGDDMKIIIGGKSFEGIIEDVFYEEDNLTRKIVLRTLR